MQTYIARLTDRGSLSEPIIWRTESIAEAREVLANVGSWQTAPDGSDNLGDDQILLGDSAFVDVFDYPAHMKDPDLALVIEDQMPRLTFSIGVRGGIRREAHR